MFVYSFFSEHVRFFRRIDDALHCYALLSWTISRQQKLLSPMGQLHILWWWLFVVVVVVIFPIHKQTIQTAVAFSVPKRLEVLIVWVGMHGMRRKFGYIYEICHKFIVGWQSRQSLILDFLCLSDLGTTHFVCLLLAVRDTWLSCSWCVYIRLSYIYIVQHTYM